MLIKRQKLLWRILKNTKTTSVLLTYLIVIFIIAALILLTEPTITTYKQALWYCYAVISTAGFGDIVVTTLFPRILSVFLTAYSALVISVITGVVVNYCTTVINMKDKETVSSFLDEIERLPELSPEELTELSEKVKKFRV